MREQDVYFWIGITLLGAGVSSIMRLQESYTPTIILVIALICILAARILTRREQEEKWKRNVRLIESARKGQNDYLNNMAEVTREMRRIKENQDTVLRFYRKEKA